jgi:hypothetical protein
MNGSIIVDSKYDLVMLFKELAWWCILYTIVEHL